MLQALDSLWRDCRFAARLLRQSPVFACTAILSLAIGIGANTAIFSLVDALMLKTLPVRNARELRVVEWTAAPRVDMPFHSFDGNCTTNAQGNRVCGSFSYPAFEALASVPQFSDVIGFADIDLTVTVHGLSEMAFGQLVSANYFSVLGVNPLLGRSFARSDESGPIVVVMGHRYWTRRFAQDPTIVGRQILVNNKPVIIAGIAPSRFLGLYPGDAPDFYLPIAKTHEIAAAIDEPAKPDHWWIQVFARMRSGAMDEPARTAATAAFLHEVESYSGRKQLQAEVELGSGARGLEWLRDQLSLPLLVLAGTVMIVLWIACANLANLLLARGNARRREMAVRLSIGAARARLFQQLLTEGVLLSFAGGLIGVAIASPILHWLLITSWYRPLEIGAALDTRTLGFTLCMSLLTGLLFSILPAIRVTKIDLSPMLKDGAISGSGTNPRIRAGRFLVSAQVALSLVLLIGASLFVRTLISLETVHLGFSSENILTFSTDPSLNGMKGKALVSLYERIRESVAAIPGVISVALARHVPMDGSSSIDGVRIAGEPIKQSYQGDQAYLQWCSASYLSTLRMPILLGRDLSSSDSTVAQSVAVVNRKFAAKFFPNRDPIGEQFFLGDNLKEQAQEPPVRIVGVSADARYADLRSEPPPTIFLAYDQHLASLDRMVFFIRTVVRPLELVNQVRKAVKNVDSSVPVSFVRTENEWIDNSIRSERLFAGLVGSLGLIAVLLAAIGLYGVVNYSVSRRTGEMGIRLALGADPRDLFWLILRECTWLVLAGLAAGLPVALVLMRLTETLLYGVKSRDTLSYLFPVLLMMAISLVAAAIPARRGAQIQPTLALKYE